MKILNWSVETFGRECNLTGLCIYCNKVAIIIIKSKSSIVIKSNMTGL